MRIPQTHQQKLKAWVHFGQAALVFLAACLALGVMTKGGGFGGETGFYFALCFLTIPALIYQVMVPMWTRAWRFANVYAYACLDVAFLILWFAASVAVAVWTSNGIHSGSSTSTSTTASSHSTPTSHLARRTAPTTTSTTATPTPSSTMLSCATFAYGSATKCEVSRASAGVGFILAGLFGVTAFFALRQVFEYKRTGLLPNGHTAGTRGNARGGPMGYAPTVGAEDASKDPWSANVDELDERAGSEDGRGHGEDVGYVGGEDRLAFASPDMDEERLLDARPGYRSAESYERPMSYTSDGTAPPAYGAGSLVGGYNQEGVQYPGGNYNRF